MKARPAQAPEWCPTSEPVVLSYPQRGAAGRAKPLGQGAVAGGGQQESGSWAEPGTLANRSPY